MIEGADLAIACARAADDRQAEDIVVLDLRGLSHVTDFFVICSATSLPHLKAIRTSVLDHLRDEQALKPTWSEGQAESLWVVLDFVDVDSEKWYQYSQRRRWPLKWPPRMPSTVSAMR